jgi:peptidoglycan/LPS O-acetylase OafA/YrhL
MGTLRLLLALCVVIAHAPDSTLFGRRFLSGITAVQGFYIVSGFLIAMVLNTRAEYRDVFRFYASRYLRLWPAYIVVASLSLVLFRHDLISRVAQLDLLSAAFVVASNCMIFLQDAFLFLAIGQNGSLYPTANFASEPGAQANTLLLVPQAWSLGIELLFYLIAPFICRSLPRLAGLFVFGLIVRLALGYLAPVEDPWSYRFTPAEMMLFAAGGLAYFLGVWLNSIADAKTLSRVGAIYLVLLAAIIITNPRALRSYPSTLFLFNQGVLVLIALSCPLLLAFSRNHRLDSLVGELSYPIYLSHVLVRDALMAFAPATLSQGNLPYVCATLAASALLVWLVVLPVDRYRQRFGARVLVDLPLANRTERA